MGTPEPNLPTVKEFTFDCEVKRMGFSQCDDEIFVNVSHQGYQGSLRRIELLTEKEVARWDFRGASLDSARYVSNKSIVLVMTGSMSLWTEGSSEPKKFDHPASASWSFSRNAQFAAAFNSDQIILYELPSGSVKFRCKFRDYLSNLFILQNGRILLGTGSRKKTLFFIDTKVGSIKEAKSPLMPMRAAISPNERFLALGKDSGLCLLDLESNEMIWRSGLLDEVSVYTLDFSSDGKHLVSYGCRSTWSAGFDTQYLVRFIDTERGDELAPIGPGSSKDFESFGFSGDGSKLSLKLGASRLCILDWSKTIVRQKTADTPLSLELKGQQEKLRTITQKRIKDHSLSDMYRLTAGEFPNQCKLEVSSDSEEKFFRQYGKARKVTQEFPLEVRWGRKLYDFLQLGLSNSIVSKRVVDLLSAKEFRGWKEIAINVNWKSGLNPEGPYYGLLATSCAGECLGQHRYFDLGKWDGSDIFSLVDSATLIVTKRVIDSLIEAGITGWKAENLADQDMEILATATSKRTIKAPLRNAKRLKAKISGTRPPVQKVISLIIKSEFDGVAEDIGSQERLLKKYERQVEKSLLPSAQIAIGAAKAGTLAVGATRLGGEPDLAEQTKWPTADGQSMAFLGQFNLEDLVKVDSENLLPQNGLLSFFLTPSREGTQNFWDLDGPVRCHAVYSDSKATLQRRTFPADLPEHGRLDVCWPAFKLTWSIPRSNHPLVEGWKLTDEEDREYGEFEGFFEQLMKQPEANNRWLGYPTPLQNSVVKQAEEEAVKYKVAKRKEPWRMILQLDSDPELGVNWGSSGYLYLLFPEADLKKRDFSRCWALTQFT